MEYEKVTHVEHILRRPDSYIGSIVPDAFDTWVFREGAFTREQVSVAPGLLKIFDEILVNAIDQHTLHPKKVSRLDVSFNDKTVTVRNNGDGIPIQKHDKEKVWIPELIFGHLLTSSNYDDTKERTTGGRNGYGAKLTNVFSKMFRVTVVSGGKKYTQVWTRNMSQVEPPDIRDYKGSGYVEIEFEPDWTKFGVGSFPVDFKKLIERRVWDAASWCLKAHVYLNNQCLHVDSFEAYAKMHVSGVTVPLGHDIVVAHSDTGKFEHVSYVNGIATTHGGTHVNRFVSQLIAALPIKVSISPAQIKASLFVFMRATRDRPTFSSQIKTECTSKDTTEYTFKPASIKAIMACGLSDDLTALHMAKTEKELKKTDGSKKSRIFGIPKLDDANWAGTHKSHDCTLIVTEGDSAKTLAVSGLSVVGRNAYGIFPLRGKPRNVRDASVKQLTENQEFSDLKKILGLQHGRSYTSIRELRYGRLMIMTDADLDGSHIKGLILNMFHHFWPELLRLGFVVAMVTPVLKVNTTWFFSEAEYASVKPSGRVKYYKGLGTSTSAEAKEYFKMIDRLTVKFEYDPDTDGSMTLAFAKAMTDARKDWLVRHMERPPQPIPYGQTKQVTITDFVHRDLAQFSAADIHRSIPHVMDGFKPSQRKVIFACLKKNLTTDMKVAQLAGYVAEHTAYHHGEASLQGTIIGLAQNFVGANNLHLLEPSGQFGTRLMGGKDCASSRYIYTRLAPYTQKIFDSRDDAVLNYVLEDGQHVEPEWYAPVVPMVLVNGAEGIGTGFSSYVPPYNIEDIKKNIRNVFYELPLVPMIPFFKGFTGTIEKKSEHTWVLHANVQKEGSSWAVTDLPPGKWIQEYKEHLDECMEKGTVQKYENHSTETTAMFRVWSEEKPEISKVIHTSNMYLMTPSGIKKFQSPEAILLEYINVRTLMYEKRKAYLLKKLRDERKILELKARFILDVIEERLVVFRRERSDLETDMERRGFPRDLLHTKTYEYTRDEVAKLQARIQEYHDESTTLGGMSVINMWEQNLNTL